MTFIEYVKFYKRNSLTNIELEVFGIPRLVTGWKALYAKLEVTDKMIDKIMSNTSVKKTHRNLAKRVFKKEDKRATGKYKAETSKLLYFMENSLGMVKIGISSDPAKRVRQITCATGIETFITCVWDVTVNARSVEKKLLREFNQYRLNVEWFSKGSITQEDIEEQIGCGFTRLEEYRPDIYIED